MQLNYSKNMTLKRLLLTVVISGLFPIAMWGQERDYSIEWSSEYRAKTAYFSNLLGATPQGFYTYKVGGKGFASFLGDEYFSYYDREHLEEQWVVQLKTWRYDGNRARLIRKQVLDSSIVLIYDAYNPRANKHHILARELNAYGEITEPVLLESIESPDKATNSISVKFSMDRKTIAVFANPPKWRERNETFTVSVFDRDFKRKWGADLELPYEGFRFNIVAFDVSNNAEVYLLGNYDNRRVLTSRDQGEYKLVIVKGDGPDDAVEYDLGLNDYVVQNIGIQCDLEGGETAITGFYSERQWFNIDGAFFMTFDQNTGKPSTVSLQKFDAEFVAQFNKSRAKKGKGIRRDFVFRDIVPKPGGGAYIVAEDYEVVQSSTRDPQGNTIMRYHYYYNDIVALSVDPNGDINWYAHIPKRQQSVDDGGRNLGYLFLQTPEGIHFVYNDAKANQKRWGNKRLRSTNGKHGAQTVMVSISNSGEMTYNVLKGGGKRFYVLPRSSAQINRGADGAILLSLRGSKLMFGNITFENNI